MLCAGEFKLRGGSELHFNFKLPHSRSCVRELCVSAEVSPHALAIMIEKLYTKTSSPMLWQTSASSGWVSHISAHTACAAQVMAFGKAKKGNCVGMKTKKNKKAPQAETVAGGVNTIEEVAPVEQQPAGAKARSWRPLHPHLSKRVCRHHSTRSR